MSSRWHWRSLAHRSGILCSPSLFLMGVPFRGRRHPVQDLFDAFARGVEEGIRRG